MEWIWPCGCIHYVSVSGVEMLTLQNETVAINVASQRTLDNRWKSLGSRLENVPPIRAKDSSVPTIGNAARKFTNLCTSVRVLQLSILEILEIIICSIVLIIDQVEHIRLPMTTNTTHYLHCSWWAKKPPKTIFIPCKVQINEDQMGTTLKIYDSGEQTSGGPLEIQKPEPSLLFCVLF